MSKRFGRNQKRRMREEIAAVTAARATDGLLLRDMRRQLDEAHDFAEAVREAVGRNAIIAGVPNRINYKMPEGERSFYQPAPMPRHAINYEPAIMDVDSYAFRNEVMHLLDIEAVRSVVAMEQHVLVNLADHRVGYAISAEALRRLSERELRNVIAPQITQFLIKSIMTRRAGGN